MTLCGLFFPFTVLLIPRFCTCYRYYTGFPKDLGPSRVIHFTSEREFVQLLHEGYPVVVAFTIRYINIVLIIYNLGCTNTDTRHKYTGHEHGDNYILKSRTQQEKDRQICLIYILKNVIFSSLKSIYIFFLPIKT